MTDAQNIVILIDNSDKSIDGDFYPNRLKAQKDATKELIRYFILKLNNRTQISIGTLGSNKIGITAYLTDDPRKLNKAIDDIEPSGSIELYKGIKFAFLVLQYQYNEEKQAHTQEKLVRKKRIIAFVSSEHSLTKEESESIQNTADNDNVSIDVIAFGNDVQSIEILSDTFEKIKDSHFLYAYDINRNLSDIVMSSPIVGDSSFFQTEYNDDPELQLAMEISYLEELKKAQAESLKECVSANPYSAQGEDQSSVSNEKIEKKPEQTDTTKTDDDEEDYSTDDQNDPDLQEAIEISRQDCHNQNGQKSDDDSDENTN